jgi:hypothetical protein
MIPKIRSRETITTAKYTAARMNAKIGTDSASVELDSDRPSG